MSVKGKKISADFNLCCDNFPVEERTKKNPVTGGRIYAARCKKCGKFVESDSRAGLVRDWNGEQPSTQLCNQCGLKLSPDWIYCPHCAHPTKQK